MRTTTLADRIKEVLDDTGITKTTLAEKAGVSKGAVTMWIQGDIKSLKFEYAVKLWRWKRYSPLWLITGEGPKTLLAANMNMAESLKPVDPWPFQRVEYARYERLRPDQKGYLEGVLVSEISQLEAETGPSTKQPGRVA